MRPASALALLASLSLLLALPACSGGDEGDGAAAAGQPGQAGAGGQAGQGGSDGNQGGPGGSAGQGPGGTGGQPGAGGSSGNQGEAGQAGAPGQASAAGEAGAAGAVDDGMVHGTLVDTYVEPTPPVAKAATGQIRAFFLDQGSFKELLATLGDDGSFTLPIPTGVDYYVGRASGKGYFHVTTRQIDLGARQGGRPDAELPTQPTALSLALDGLSPWQSGDLKDELDLLSPGASMSAGLAGPLGDALASGATGVKGSVDLLSLSSHLLSGSKGDQAYLVQRVAHLSGDWQSWTTERSALVTAPDIADGGKTTLTASLSATPLSPHSFTWKGSAFASLLSGVAAPGAPYATIEFSVEPGGETPLYSFFYPELARALNTATPSADAALSLAFGNPFPSPMLPIVLATYSVPVRLALPLGGQVKSMPASVTLGRTLAEADGSSFAPDLGPVTDLTIAGQPTQTEPDGTKTHLAPLSSVGTTPEVSWKAPSLGKPTHYRVVVVTYDTDGNRSNVGSVITTKTSVVLPPGIIEQGKQYAVRVVAVANPVYSEAHPSISTASPSTAQAVSPAFMP